MTACCHFADTDTGECCTKQFMFLDTCTANLISGSLNILLRKAIFRDSLVEIGYTTDDLSSSVSHLLCKQIVNAVKNDLVWLLFCKHGAKECTVELKWTVFVKTSWQLFTHGFCYRQYWSVIFLWSSCVCINHDNQWSNMIQTSLTAAAQIYVNAVNDWTAAESEAKMKTEVKKEKSMTCLLWMRLKFKKKANVIIT